MATVAMETPRSCAMRATTSTIALSLSSHRGSTERVDGRVGLGAGRALLAPRASELAGGERAPRDRADALVGEQAEHLALLFAGEQAVPVLHGDELGPAVALGGVLHLREPPRPHRRRAEVARLADLDDIV